MHEKDQSSPGALKETLILINSFVHDMSTGIWLGTIVVMYKIYTTLRGDITLEMVRYINNVLEPLWELSIASFVVMIGTGAGRAFSLKYYGWTGDIAKGRKRMLLIKHLILTVLVALGLVVQSMLYFAQG